ncbi:hypothetical protein FHX10_006645 [Rhizobium sp. BK591]|nr:hypothetical protein [Rhizobium sp. BK591]
MATGDTSASGIKRYKWFALTNASTDTSALATIDVQSRTGNERAVV